VIQQSLAFWDVNRSYQPWLSGRNHQLVAFAGIRHRFPDVRIRYFWNGIEKSCGFQIERLELSGVGGSEVCSYVANLFQHLKIICLLGFRTAMEPARLDGEPELLVEKVVDMLQPFVEHSAKLEECRVLLPFYDTRHQAEQLLLTHPRVRQWPGRIRIRVGSWYLQGKLFRSPRDWFQCHFSVFHNLYMILWLFFALD